MQIGEKFANLQIWTPFQATFHNVLWNTSLLSQKKKTKERKKTQLLRSMIKQNLRRKTRKKEAIQDKLASLGVVSFHRDSPRWPKGKWRDVH